MSGPTRSAVPGEQRGKPGDTTTTGGAWVKITVSNRAVPAHLRMGDHEPYADGSCVAPTVTTTVDTTTTVETTTTDDTTTTV